MAFIWDGNTGGIKSPAQVDRERKVAEALLAPKAVAQDPWSGLSQVASALSGSVLRGRADEAQQAGMDSGNAAFAGLADGNASQAEIIAALSNPWTQENAGQSAVTQALLQQNMNKQDPAYQLDLQLKQAQLAKANTPDRQSLINTPSGIFDPNNGSWIQPPGVGETGAPPPNFDDESKLRTEYGNTNTVKDFGLQTQAYQRVLDSAKDPSPAGDLALIFNYMKVLDPGSTVREGEFATAQNSGSLPEQIMSQYNKVLSGERLVPEIRKDFVNRAGQLFQGAAGLQQGTNDRYNGLAEGYGLDPARITAPIPQIGVLDPSFNIDEYLTQTPDGPVQTKPLPVTSDADYDALPSGAVFVGPDGQTRKKP